MFRRRDKNVAAKNMGITPGRGATTTSTDGEKEHGDTDEFKTPILSPAELRAGLGSLGIPLGDADLKTLVGKTDPNRRGQVSYGDFCDTLRLHRISCGHDPQNPQHHSPRTSRKQQGNGSLSESANVLTSYDIGQGEEGVLVSPRRSGGGGRIGLGSARRRARSLAPADDVNLDGGLFHRNPATEGCRNPNFTTSMIPARGNFNSLGEREGWGRERAASMSDIGSYRPGRRQSPAPAPGLRYTRCQPGSQGQSILFSDNHSRLWSSTGEEAEAGFRHILGIKARSIFQTASKWYCFRICHACMKIHETALRPMR